MRRNHLLAGFIIGGLLVSLPLVSGCDTGTPGPVFADTGVRVEVVTPRAQDFTVNVDGDIAFFEHSTNLLTPAVVDEGAVLLYARGDLIFVGESGIWTALPYTQGIEAVGDDGVPYVDYTITYSYSFEPGWLYLDVVSSALGLVEDFVPHNIPFRLVTIPPSVQRVEGVDYSDYDAVMQAYGVVG